MSPARSTVEVKARTDERAMKLILELTRKGICDPETARRLLGRCLHLSIDGGPWQYMDGDHVIEREVEAPNDAGI
jgi:hypothetical protein